MYKANHQDSSVTTGGTRFSRPILVVVEKTGSFIKQGLSEEPRCARLYRTDSCLGRVFQNLQQKKKVFPLLIDSQVPRVSNRCSTDSCSAFLRRVIVTTF